MIEDRNRIPEMLQATDAMLQRVADKVGQYLEGRIRDMINTQWPGWPPLAASTVIQRKKPSTKAWADTGNLKDEITNRILQGHGLGKTIQIGIFESEYGFIAHCLEFGTDAYVIRPRNKKALKWKGMSHPVRVVHHPGIPERPLFRLVFDLEEEKVVRLIQKALEEELDRFQF